MGKVILPEEITTNDELFIDRLLAEYKPRGIFLYRNI